MQDKPSSAILDTKRACLESLHVTPQEPSCSTQHRSRTTFNLLPENVLLEIFAIRAYEDTDSWAQPWRWDKVAHVCRTWRRVVLSSPRRLKLFLRCTYGNPIVDILSHLSHFPILIDYYHDERRTLTPEDEDNIVYALRQSSRIVQISVPITPSLATKLATVPWGEKPFGRLIHLNLFCSKDRPGVTLPGKFLSASTPRLRRIRLEGVVVPSLPKILASTRIIWNFPIGRIPDAGRSAPAALTPHISTTSHLRSLDIHYFPSASHPQATAQARSPPSLAPIVLPLLAEFQFRGASEDLEDLVSHFVAPHLKIIRINLHNQLIVDLTHLALFLSRCNARVAGKDVHLNVRRGSGASLEMSENALVQRFSVECRPLDWQISALAQISSSLHHIRRLSTMKSLWIFIVDSLENPPPAPEPDQDEPEPDQWLELLQPFNTVEKLWLEGLAGGCLSGLCQALHTLASGGEEALSVLPALRKLHLEVQSDNAQCSVLLRALGPFIEARRLSDRPVTVSSNIRSSLHYK
ncbi:hypothetical protein BC834DRAFT_58977 [Gloeopeniophorella convolvens]|nr:hypothetical protein BC834DRAFT_58977 [Gloeopeniophorella convolvens]